MTKWCWISTKKSSLFSFLPLTHHPLIDQELLQANIQDHSGLLGLISPQSCNYLLSSSGSLIQI